MRIKQHSNDVHTGTAGSRGIRFITKPQTLRVPYIDRALFDLILVQDPGDNVIEGEGDRSIVFHASFAVRDYRTSGVFVVLYYNICCS